MKIRIGTRRSDLARLMAGHVGHALMGADPALKIEYVLKSSEGDRDRTTPLWALSDKGAFTRDLSLQLVSGSIDIAVHSWKDLPVESDLPTVIAGTLPRADARDVLFIPKTRWIACAKARALKVLSSSPRRAYNLAPFLKTMLPAAIDDITFESVRGNIPSRARKVLDGEGDALVVAKAALDRLLAATEPEFESARRIARDLVDSCFWMITPLSMNPCAPAQGAIAIEVLRERDDVLELVERIGCRRTSREVRREREILARYGGGCHQKIGVSVVERDFGTVTFVRGLTDDGEVLDVQNLDALSPKQPKATPEAIWPREEREASIFSRREIAAAMPEAKHACFMVARANALPESWKLSQSSIVWAAGVETWRKLAKRGVWVHGCADSLGEAEPRLLDHFVDPDAPWYKLTHSDAPEGELGTIVTYELVPGEIPEDVADKTHFFWKSGSLCARVLEAVPEMRERWHACGPGNSYSQIKKLLGGEENLSVALNYGDWKKRILEGK